MNRLTEVLSGTFAQQTKAGAVIAAALNKAYNASAKFRGEETTRDLTVEEILCLDPKTFAAVEQDAVAAFTAGQKTTVEVEPSKKNKGAAQK